MSLTLRLTSSGTLPNNATSVAMENGVLTIGRGDENTLALPDPDRMLSKRHCVVEERGGDYLLTDISTNGTFLNYSAERVGEIPTPLSHGDVIQVGDFELVVEIGGAQPAAALPMAPAEESLPTAPSSAPEPLATLDDPLAEGGGGDFLDDLLGSPAAPADIPLAPDPLAEGASVPDHSPAAQDHFTPPAPNAPAIPDDWDDLFAPEPAPSTPADPFDAQAAPPPGAMPPPAAQPPAPASTDAARAFLETAGAAHLEIPAEELAATMARLGRTYAAMVAGMREILMARASIKSEMRMERTMISMGGNNPLKFSISPEQAVEAMIRPTVTGYLDAETATAEALADIRAHEVAMMSGMEAALKDLLTRLGPDRLATRIESGSSLGGLLGRKKARYWEAYERMYAEIARETEDDFQSAFGREFARAYEEQLKKL